MRLQGMILAAALLWAPAASAEWVNPFAYPQPEEVPQEFFVLVEIPQGSFTKYEVDADNGAIFVDRYMSMPVGYPANYGSIPSSMNVDGDPLDALVLTRAPVQSGAMIKVRPIGILKMVDGGEQDDKIVAVPASDIDPTYDEVRTVDDLPEMERNRIEGFFSVYKNLPEGSDVVEMGGYEGVDAAVEVMQSAFDAYATN